MSGSSAVEERLTYDADAHRWRPARETRGELTVSAADADRIERVVTRDRVHHDRRVLDPTGNGAHVIVQLGQRHDAADAREAVSGLQSHDAAARGRKPDRRGGVRPQRRDTQPSRDRSRGSARRPTRHVLLRPRVGNGPVVRDHAGAAVRELVHVQLAEQHRARFAQPRDDRRIVGRDAVGVDGTRCRGADAGRVDVVLQRDRDAVQRPAIAAGSRFGVERPCLRQRRIGQHRDEGIDARIQPLDPLQVRARERFAGQLASGDALRGLGERQQRGIDARRRRAGIRCRCEQCSRDCAGEQLAAVEAHQPDSIW